MPPTIDVSPFKPQQRAFLDAYPRFRTITHTADALGIPRQSVYDWQANTPGFADALVQVKEAVGDEVEAEMLRRALAGESQMSDTLLIFATKRFRPEYRDSYQVNVRQESISISLSLDDMPAADKLQLLDRLRSRIQPAALPESTEPQ